MTVGPKPKAERRTEAQARKAAVATRRLKALHKSREAAERVAEKATAAEQLGYLKAHQAGLTYPEIAAIVGKAEITINKAIARQRKLNED